MGTGQPGTDAELDRELRQMFEALEGPPFTERHGAARRSRPRRFFAVAGLAAAAVIVITATVGVRTEEDRRPQTSAGCAALLTFNAIGYEGRGLPDPLLVGAALGEATGPGCTDEVGQNRGATAEPTRTVPVRAIIDVDPDTALIAPSEPRTIYVAAGRCLGFSAGRPLVDCLRTKLVFQGKEYVASRLENRLRRASPLGCALRGSQDVVVTGLAGIDPRVAVAVSGDPAAIYIADGHCHLSVPPEAPLVRCLRTRP